MPELPEVETIRLGLEKYLVGHKIVDIDVRLQKILQGETLKIKGARIKGVRRFGKALVIDLDNGYSIAAHIKLTGQFVYRESRVPRVARLSRELVGDLPGKHTHVTFKLDKGAALHYNDVRQFGWIRILKTEDVEKLSFIHELGPEPPVAKAMGGRSHLTQDKFREIIRNKSAKIKVLLMDQKKIGGVGNIYANDALFLARIDPRRAAKSLAPKESLELYNAILEVLKRGLKYGGATELNYVNALGEAGRYQEYFLAYGQDKKPCSRCGTAIKKIRLGGRGTYFCPNCQK